MDRRSLVGYSTFVIVQLLSLVRLFATRGLKHFLVLHHLPGFTQTHVHWVDDAIQPSHLLLPAPVLNLCQHQGLFLRVSSSHQVAKVLESQKSDVTWQLKNNRGRWLKFVQGKSLLDPEDSSQTCWAKTWDRKGWVWGHLHRDRKACGSQEQGSACTGLVHSSTVTTCISSSLLEKKLSPWIWLWICVPPKVRSFIFKRMKAKVVPHEDLSW